MGQLQKPMIVSCRLDKKSSSAGYSLIEILVAVGILGIVMVGLTGILTQSTSSMGKVNSLADATSQITLIKSALEDPVACRLNFGGKRPPVPDTDVKNKEILFINKTSKECF